MAVRGKRRAGRLKETVAGCVAVVVLLLAGSLAIEEMSASQGDFRRTLWDRIVGRPDVPQGRAEVSIQLAQEVCRQKVVGDLGSSLLQASFDNRSSRYDPDFQVHTVFLDLVVEGKRGEDVYVRCDVSAVDRTIIEYRIKGWGNPFWG